MQVPGSGADRRRLPVIPMVLLPLEPVVTALEATEMPLIVKLSPLAKLKNKLGEVPLNTQVRLALLVPLIVSR